MKDLTGKKIAFLVAQEGVEEVELTQPWEAVEQAGATPVLVAPEEGEVQTFNHLDKASTYHVDETLAEADPQEYAGVVLPGGVANPDQLRMDDDAIQFIQDIFIDGKPVGVICHGSWTLVEANVLRGRKLTSWPSLQTDIENAGGIWVDEEVVVDQRLVSSRNPDDLPAFCETFVDMLAEWQDKEGEDIRTLQNGGEERRLTEDDFDEPEAETEDVERELVGAGSAESW